MSWLPADRVLSIQSHVAYGYVGGKAAVFPLQCLGYDVDVVNTVNYSNHAGYARSGGTKTAPDELSSIFNALEQNELLNPARILTGYIPGGEALSTVKGLVEKLKRQKASITYLLDPVMGDAGRLYVSPDVIPIYRSMLSVADIIAPNWFEVELLTEMKLTDMSALRKALHTLHKQYQVPHVVISSIPLSSWLWSALPPSIRPENEASYLMCLTSSSPTPQAPTSSTSTVHAQCVPLLPGYFSGVGDLFSALLLAHFRPNEPPRNVTATHISDAASQALTKTHAILRITHGQASTLPEGERLPSDDELDKAEPLRRTRRMRGRELALIRGQDVIRGAGIRSLRELMVWDDFWTT